MRSCAHGMSTGSRVSSVASLQHTPARRPWGRASGTVATEHRGQVPALAAAGFTFSALLVLAAGRTAVPAGVVLQPGFGGLLHPSTGGGTGPVLVVIAALTALVLLWWRAVRAATQGRLSPRQVAVLAVCWTAPILLGPPLLSLDAWAYLAQGAMVHSGLDPYSAGPVLLGADPAAARVDPMWRSSPVPYGPLALVLFGAVARASSPEVGLILLRLVALAGVVVAVAVAASMVPVARRTTVLTLTVLNPVVLVHLVGGAHVDALVAGIACLGCLALVRRRAWVALVLAAFAVAVKVTMLPLLAFALLAVVRSEPRRWRTVTLVPLVVVLPFVVTLPLLTRPWGFVAALSVPGGSAPWYAPATMLGELCALAGALLHLPVDPALFRAAGRGLALLLGAAVVLRLLRAEWRDPAPSPSRSTARRASYSLLVASLCLPSLYAWYVGAALLLLLALAPRLQLALVALSSALTFTALPPMADANQPLLLIFGGAAATLLITQAWGLLVLRGGAASVKAPARSVHRRRRAVLPVAGMLTAAGLLLVVPYAASSQAAREPVSVAVRAAESEALQDESPQRVELIQFVHQHYAGWQILQLIIQPGDRLRVDLVRPPGDRCLLLLDRATPPVAFTRVPLPSDLSRRALEERTCPAADLPDPGVVP